MFIGNVFWRNANDGGAGDDLDSIADALADGSSAASPSAPDAGQEPQHGDQNPVPYQRFQEVNSKLAGTMAEVEQLRAQLDQYKQKPATPAAGSNSGGLDAKSISKAVADALAAHGIVDVVRQNKAMQTEQKKAQILGQLRSMPNFNEARDLPRIAAKMREERVGALTAFKILSFDGPQPGGPMAHDAPRGGFPTGGIDQPKRVDLHTKLSPTEREQEVTERFKGLIDRDPAMRRALELE